jgi:SWIRM domain
MIQTDNLDISTRPSANSTLSQQQQPQTSHLQHSKSTDSMESDSIAMISPPLSPYPKLAQLNRPDSVIPRSTTISEPNSQAAKELVDSLSRIAAEEERTSQDNKENDDRNAFISTDEGVIRQSSKFSSRTGSPAPAVAYKVEKHNPKSSMVTSAWDSLKSNPVAYFKRERAYLDLYPINGPTWSNYVYVEQPHSISVPRPSSRLVRNRLRRRGNIHAAAASFFSDDSDGGMMTRSSARNSPALSVMSDSVLPPLNPQRAVSRGPASVSRPSTPRSSTPRPAKPRSAASPAPSRVHDLALSQIVDYSPSTSLLPPGNKSLKAEWKGAPMDLSTDPNVQLLHPAEIHLASVLRLPCDVYLDSKRRLFAEKVHRLRQGLPFRRTDSQKACRIDVNKASRLFTAFERVGWLEDDLFQKYL